MDTAHAHPDDPQPLGASLRRSSDDRILLGLCAGLARTAGVSPLALRLATVLTSFLLLPFVLVAYVVTAVIVPRDDGAALVGTGWRDRRDVWVALALTLLAAPSALSVGDGDGPFVPHHFGFIAIPIIALGALAFLAVRRDRERAGNPQTFTPAPPATPTAVAEPAASAEAEQPPHAGPVAAEAGDATAVTSAFAAGDGAGAADTVDAVSGAADPGAMAAADAPAEPDPSGAPTFVRTPQTPSGPAAPKRPGLTLPVLGAVAMVPAIFAILLAAGAVEPKASSWGVMLAVMAVVSAAGAVAIAILRPSYLGAGLLVLLAAALGISSIGVSQFGAVLGDGVGQREYRITTTSDLREPFVLGAGEMDIDLRPLELEPRQRVTVRAKLGFGEMNIAVPRGTRIVTTEASKASGLTTTARENGAASSESADAPTIVLDLRGRGINARVVSGRARDVSTLDVIAETDLGFWSGGRRDAPFATGPYDSLLTTP